MADIENMRVAMNLMRRPGAHLIQTNRNHLSLHYIVPKGGSVSSPIAEKIKNHPQVKGDEDALWP